MVLLIVLPLGFALKYYRGPGQCWVNNWGPASVAYEVCFMLLAFLVVPRRSAITPSAVGCVLGWFLLHGLLPAEKGHMARG